MTRRLPPWAPFLPRRTDTMSEQESSVEVSRVTRGVEALQPPPHINLCNPVVSILGRNVNNPRRTHGLCSQTFRREIQGMIAPGTTYLRTFLKQLIIHCKELMFKFRHCRSIWVGHSGINQQNVHRERQNEFM